MPTYAAWMILGGDRDDISQFNATIDAINRVPNVSNAKVFGSMPTNQIDAFSFDVNSITLAIAFSTMDLVLTKIREFGYNQLFGMNVQNSVRTVSILGIGVPVGVINVDP